MKVVIKNYTYNPIAFNHHQVTFNDYSSIDIERVIRIYNLTVNALMYEVDPLGIAQATVSGNVFDLLRGFTPMQATDKLHIMYDDPTYDVAGAIADNRRSVTTAGTRVQLSTSSVPCKGVAITAEATNTGVIVVGGSTVVASPSTRRGTPLAAGDTCTLDIDNLNKVYLDATINGEGVTYILVV